ncbi:MAG: ABC transporter ATP-binding protein [Eubacteriales bacterium]|nr:ABC transporter ATP-binding protein [Eubacteriales bacterium]
MSDQTQVRNPDRKRLRTLFGFLKEHSRDQYSKIALGLVLTLIYVAGTMLHPYVTGLIIDQPRRAQIQLTVPQLILIFIGVYCFNQAIQAVKNVLFAHIAARICENLQNALFRHLQRLPLRYYENMPAGSVVSRVMGDTGAVGQLYESFLSNVLSVTIQIVSIFIAMASSNWILMIICLVTSLPTLFILRYYLRKTGILRQRERRALAEFSGKYTESIHGADIITVLNQRQYKMAELDEVNDRMTEISLSSNRLEANYSWPFYGAMEFISKFMGLLYFGIAILFFKIDLSYTLLYVFLSYSGNIIREINNLSYRLYELQRALAAADHLGEIFDEEAETHTSETLAPLQGEIEFRNIHFAYVEGEEVLQNVSLKIHSGETVAFVGRTGSGKSSMTQILYDFYQPQSGEILIDGRSIKDYPIYSLREQMAIVLQDPFIFNASVRENISLGNPKISDEDCWQALETVGADSLLEAIHGDLDYQLRGNGQSLSAGERQLLSFARALAHQPRILILDEATSSVDTNTEFRIREAMYRLAEGRTMIVIAHRLSTIRNADQIYVFDHGKIVQQGCHEELVAVDGIYREMARQQELLEESGRQASRV